MAQKKTGQIGRTLADPINFVEEKPNLWPPTGIIAGLISGIISGAVLSLGYLFFVRGIEFNYFVNQIFVSIFVFGIVGQRSSCTLVCYIVPSGALQGPTGVEPAAAQHSPCMV